MNELTKYPQSVREGAEHHFITQDLVDEFREVLFTHPKFNELAEEYARKQVASVLQEYRGKEVTPEQLEEELGRPIMQTDLGCDKYYQWFGGLIAAYLSNLSPYPVRFDRYLEVA